MQDELNRPASVAPESKRRELEWEDYFAGMVRSFRRELNERRTEMNRKEFMQHTRAARREMLLAFRSLVDDAIEQIDKSDVTDAKATRINIE